MLQSELSIKASVVDPATTLEADRVGPSVTPNVGIQKRPDIAQRDQ